MSEKSLRVSLNELNTVRVVCENKQGGQRCGAVIETSLAKLGNVHRCPLCNQALFSDGVSPLNVLANVVRELVQEKEHAHVEFVLPDRD